MRVLITGAKGFVGKNLCAALKNIRDGKDRRFPELKIEEIFEYDLDSTPEQLDQWCKEADFVFIRKSLCRATLALPAPCWIH